MESSGLTEQEAITLLWSGKSAYLMNKDGTPKLDENKRPVVNDAFIKGVFVYATLRREVETTTAGRRIKAGTRVLVTVVSRFGDVGIRDDRLTPPSDGYYARVPPKDLQDWAREP